MCLVRQSRRRRAKRLRSCPPAFWYPGIESHPSKAGPACLVQRGKGGARRAEDTSGIRHAGPAQRQRQPTTANNALRPCALTGREQKF